MTSRTRFAWVVLGTLAFVACADDQDLKDTRPTDGDVSDVIGIEVDTDTGTVEDTESTDTGSSSMDSSSGDTGVTDTGTASTDSGTVDTGTAVVDTGTVVTDTGTAVVDTGTAVVDTGTVVTDTGTVVTDTGTPVTDTGTAVVDTGTAVTDTGTLDTGPFDTGTALDSATVETSIATDTGVVSDAIGLDSTFKADAAADFGHTIAIDGINDFTSSEKFLTTSGGYDAYVTWDASYVYVGYAGSDIGTSSSPTKWVMVHIDGLLGAGSTTTELYTTQQHQFPAGFDSDLYFAWKTDGTYQQLKTWNGVSWVTSATTVVVAKTGNYVEMAIPLSVLGARTKLGVTTFMMNEGSGSEWTYAGLYVDSFIDGYSASGTPKTIAHWVDGFSGMAPPNDPTRKKP
ncbi:MAG: hypothetical protein ACXVEE_14050 [Polyangiales bacterium]